ncbi:hypothetical protein [Pigmentiphaga litoralis]|uniref:Uncharacterized protein n=1 Tax=Pigmentiphaga litoralis TaxID=516702 RepID=A0A7Y9LNE6_9BURK|nr:hypothetical protein [Pigmentiphaga litoralis]NYE23165.1 hypothetical protein [Pigmentiphaga litoralis]NYE83220.1 hypothetical protein [Pigmentiphaga litoralis]
MIVAIPCGRNTGIVDNTDAMTHPGYSNGLLQIEQQSHRDPRVTPLAHPAQPA